MKFWGIDLHTDNFTATFFDINDPEGRRITKKFPLTGKGFLAFLAMLSKGDYIAIETTGNSFWFYDQVKPYVNECFILNTNKIRLEDNKTDKIDSAKILDYLCYFLLIKGLDAMPKVFVPPAEVRVLRGLFSTYRLTKKINTQLRNRIHSVFKQNGIIVKKGAMESKIGRKRILEMKLQDIWKKQVISLMNQLETVIFEIDELKDTIICKGYELTC
jgi:transposase